jgi:hypothetical protein
MPKTLLFRLTNLTARLAWSQDSIPVYHQPSRFAVKLALLSLLDQDATVQAGLEYRHRERISVQP